MASKAGQHAFPYQQMAILSVCRFAEPVAQTSVNPYIPEMVASFNVPTDKIGMYSGWLSAAFSLCQAVTGVAWGRASDQLGRKPMILLALTLIMISSVLFGFSTSLTMAFVTRSVQGSSAGNVGIIRTVVAEMVPHKELQPRAFSIMPLIWNIGSIFGPSLGGFLSNPQRRGWFTGSKLLAQYPFALPNLTISVFFIIGILTGFLFLRETHEVRKYRKDYGLLLGSLLTRSCSKRDKGYWRREDDESDPFLDANGSAATSPVATKPPTSPLQSKKQSAWRDVFTRQSNINLIAYTGLAMHSTAFDQLLPVFMHHPVQSHETYSAHSPLRFSGGFGLDSGQIGVLFTVYGIFGMLVQFLVFPPLAQRFGVLRCFKVCAIVFPCVYLVIPFVSLLSTSGLRQGFCLLLMLIKCAAGIFAFPCSTILLTNSATSLSVLGTLNGVATSISATGRAAGPALTGMAFTIGVDIGYIVVPFWVLCTVSVLAAVPIWWLIEMDGFSADAGHEEDDEDSNEESEDQRRIRLGGVRSEAAEQTGSTGILDGTEAAELLPDDVPLLKSPAARLTPENGDWPPSGGSLQRLISPVEVNPNAASSHLTRRHSTNPDTTLVDDEAVGTPPTSKT